MYSDRVETKTGIRITFKNHLNSGSGDFSSRGRQITRKRDRQVDDKWEHDLFEDYEPRNSNCRFDRSDLRLKLQKKHNGLQSGRRGAERDLREKLSGTMNPPKFKREAARPALKKFAGETKSETRTASKKKSQQFVIFWFRLVHPLIASWNHWVSRNIRPRFKLKKLIWML